MPTPKKTKNAKNAIRSFNKRMTSKLPKVRTVRNYARPISRVANMMRLAARARKTKRNR
jgi:hypothetical protein